MVRKYRWSKMTRIPADRYQGVAIHDTPQMIPPSDSDPEEGAPYSSIEPNPLRKTCCGDLMTQMCSLMRCLLAGIEAVYVYREVPRIQQDTESAAMTSLRETEKPRADGACFPELVREGDQETEDEASMLSALLHPTKLHHLHDQYIVTLIEMHC
jgi:hypothetical protein